MQKGNNARQPDLWPYTWKEWKSSFIISPGSLLSQRKHIFDESSNNFRAISFILRTGRVEGIKNVFIMRVTICLYIIFVMNISESWGSPVYWKLPFMSSFSKEGTGGALIAPISTLCVCRESNWQVVKSALWPSEWDEPNGSVNEGRCERKSCGAERTSEATPLHTQASQSDERRKKVKK